MAFRHDPGDLVRHELLGEFGVGVKGEVAERCIGGME